MLHNDNDDENPQLFPETETRRVAERFAPKPVSTPREVGLEGVRAIEEALRKEPERPPLFKSLRVVLDERNKIHGEFTNDARTSQALKHVMHETKNWSDLTFVQKEALEHIATKIGRILSGNPNHVDHWSDIQGYARLVEERL